jgi:N utilization substance protein B
MFHGATISKRELEKLQLIKDVVRKGQLLALLSAPELDAEIARLARGWELGRIAALEKSIMRVALFELRHRDDVPTEVAIDEAVALAGRYCGADAPGFVNGVLGSAARAASA